MRFRSCNLLRVEHERVVHVESSDLAVLLVRPAARFACRWPISFRGANLQVSNWSGLMHPTGMRHGRAWCDRSLNRRVSVSAVIRFKRCLRDCGRLVRALWLIIPEYRMGVQNGIVEVGSFPIERLEMADDNITNALEELDQVVAYGKRYKGANDFAFNENEMRLVRAIRYLAVELQALRDED